MEIKGKELDESINEEKIFPELKVDSNKIKLSGNVSLNSEDAYKIIYLNN